MSKRIGTMACGLCLGLIVSCVLGGRPHHLSAAELNATRGASMVAGKCNNTCNVASQMSLCVWGFAFDGDPCSTCENASTMVDYLDQARPACPASTNGYREKSTFSSSCGHAGNGTCLDETCQDEVYSTSQLCGPRIIESQVQ